MTTITSSCLDACRVVTPNVIGMGEATIMTACAVAERFSVLSSTVATAARVPAKLRAIGIEPWRCVSVRPVGMSDEVVRNRKKLLDHYCELGHRCITDGAGVTILSCAGMSDIKEYLEQQLKVPVIAGVISALKIAEQFSAVQPKQN